MATDIAIVTGVVAMLGTRAPSWLKLFLLTLAIADDIGAIIVIAIFYSEGVSLGWLAAAVGTLVVAAVLRSRVELRRRVPPARRAVLVVVARGQRAHDADGRGVRPAGAGHPAPQDRSDRRRRAGRASHRSATRPSVSRQAQLSVSVVEWLEYKLHPWSAFVVVPVFALANAGIHIPTGGLGEAFSQPRDVGGHPRPRGRQDDRHHRAPRCSPWRSRSVGSRPDVTTRYVIGAGSARRHRFHGVAVRHRPRVRRQPARHRRAARRARRVRDGGADRHRDLPPGRVAPSRRG